MAPDQAPEWSTGEVATTTLEPPRDPSLDQVRPMVAAEQAIEAPPSQGRPELGTFGKRAGRGRNRPGSVSGRLPMITPQMPIDAPLELRASDPVEIREATPDQTGVLPGAVPTGVPTVLRTDLDLEPDARHGDESTLPSAEMLAMLVEPEPINQLMPEPDPDDAPMSAARVTRSLPVVFRRRMRKRVRRVTRVVRHIDTWSVFKVALIFNVVLYVVCLTAGVLLWNVAYTTGTIDNVEKFFEQFGWSSFQFNGGELFHNGWVAGLFAIVGLTGLAVLLATLFNLITDLVGGVRVSVLEEEVIARPVGAETTLVRRKPRRDRADRALHAVARLEQDAPVHPSSVRRTSMPRFKRRPADESSSSIASPAVAADDPGQWG